MSIARGTQLEKRTIEGHNVFVERVLPQQIELGPEILLFILSSKSRQESFKLYKLVAVSIKSIIYL